MTIRSNRRGFMLFAGTLVFGAAPWLATFSGCGPGEGADARLSRQLAEAIAALVPAAATPAPPGSRSADEAARALVEGLSKAEVDALLLDAAALRARIAERGQADLIAGRSTWVGGWLLSQTELDVALLAGAAP